MMSRHDTRFLFGACITSLCSLALIVWSQLDPRPIPVIVAMSIGQALGTVSLLVYLWVAIRNFVRKPEPPPKTPDSTS